MYASDMFASLELILSYGCLPTFMADITSFLPSWPTLGPCSLPSWPTLPASATYLHGQHYQLFASLQPTFMARACRYPPTAYLYGQGLPISPTFRQCHTPLACVPHQKTRADCSSRWWWAVCTFTLAKLADMCTSLGLELMQLLCGPLSTW